MRRKRKGSVIYHVRRRCKANKQEETTRKKCNQRQEVKAVATAAEYEANEDGDKKLPKDRSNYKCWSCSEFGHLAYSKHCMNYKKKKGGRHGS
jgi:hypothetical protein